MTNTVITYDNFTGDPFSDLPADDWTKRALDVLDWAYRSYDSITYACSFGAEGIVLIDLIAQVKEDAKIVFLDTGIHFQETYDLIDKVKKRYPSLTIEMKQPELTLEEQAEEHGSALWKRNPDQCCFIRKIKPLEEALTGVEAWVSGLRREQSLSRSNTDFVNKDDRFRSVKVCPLIHWTWDDVWSYIRSNELEYNVLHDEGYPSIGCIPCTFKAESGGRDGRWKGMDKTECGLHTDGQS
ncbi:phosphoadenylyl-sulfate reductase [Salimicrobium sp. PL1-032A]|uniref:phosphoadenylyl-sulfate reductase n=1 Tax=Salimicrobium sp. PL1-032A TaxID=3095364 RepID=UPI0032612FF4